MNTNNEQLEAAKGWYKIAKEQNNNVAIEILENIFPELAESEDEKIRKAIITHFENIHKREKLESFYGVDIEPILAWLEKQANQKPAWSEEDKEKLETIIDAAESHCFLTLDDIDWIKSLKDRVQPKQEWSEEDEECLENAIMYCEWARGKAPDFHCYKTSEKSIDWLKSLRPQNRWKPSDEQMNALQTAIGIVGELTPTALLLKEIREQLKKLREE